MDSHQPEPSEEGSTSLASDAVRAMLERHEVPKHRQASLVKELFGLSRAAAHRRTHGTAAWTLEELQLVAQTFGETLPQMLDGGVAHSQDGSADTRLKVLEARVEALEKALGESARLITKALLKPGGS